MSKSVMQMCADEIAGYLKRIADLENQLQDWQDGTIIAQWQDCEQKVKGLEKQLAEKEKEIEELRFKERNIFPLVKNLGQKVDQAKTDFAIEQLEKVKYDFFDISNGWWLCFRDGTQYMTHRELEGCVKEVIDNQIKELRGQK